MATTRILEMIATPATRLKKSISGIVAPFTSCR
jgi:hypothetical protein